MATLTASYPTSNKDDATQLIGIAEQNGAYGESFQASVAGTIDHVDFYLKRNGTLGSAYAKVYNHSGVFGTSSLPDGAAIATSAPLDLSALSTDVYEVKTFTFDNTVPLVAGTNYVVAIEYAGDNVANYIWVGRDTSAETAAGNSVNKYGTDAWTNYPTNAFIFYVYVTETVPTIGFYTGVTEGGTDGTLISSDDSDSPALSFVGSALDTSFTFGYRLLGTGTPSTADVTFTAPTGCQVSANGSTWGATADFPYPTTVNQLGYIRQHTGAAASEADLTVGALTIVG